MKREEVAMETKNILQNLNDLHSNTTNLNLITVVTLIITGYLVSKSFYAPIYSQSRTFSC